MGAASRTKRSKKEEQAPVAASASFNSSVLKCTFTGQALWFSVTLVLANIAVYWGVWRFEFVRWDDTAYVTENSHVLAGLTWPGVQWAFTTGFGGSWNPITWLSHMADIQLFGVNAGAHHFTNLFLHSITTVLLFGLLHAMTGAIGRSAFVAALFAVHPMHVESVAWIAERKDVLSTLFWMLTMWQYYRYVRRPKASSYALMVICFALGLMSKP